MADKPESRPISIPQVLAVVGLVVIGYFVYSFGLLVWDGLSLKRIAEGYERDIATVTSDIYEIDRQKVYVTSDAFAEEYARDVRKWTRPGETAVVVLDAPDADWRARPGVQSESTHSPKEHWREWWALFWDNSP